MSRKICVFTGTRAEYGLLRKLILALRADGTFNLTVLVSGTHLSAEFGNTINELFADGITNIEKCEVLLSSDTSIGVSKSIGLGLIGYAEILDRIQPDLAIGLGDRFELLAFATAAMMQTVPMLHLHGGELTIGAIDDSIRHAITKMARYHGVSTEEYGKRVIRMGENPADVWTVGALGVDNIRDAPRASRSELAESVPLLKDYSNIILVTVHPETAIVGSTQKNIEELLLALDVFRDFGIVFTGANSDADGRLINETLSAYSKARANCYFTMSLGMYRYLGMMQIAHAVVGNSSSGIIEASAMGIPSVDIGSRQEGRTCAASVFHCGFEKDEIVNAIETACAARDTFEDSLESNPYWHGGAVKNIMDMIRKIPEGKADPKKFYDSPEYA